jgi:putative transposase
MQNVAVKYVFKIKIFIKNQLQEDIASDQISMKELFDPFNEVPDNKKKK